MSASAAPAATVRSRPRGGPMAHAVLHRDPFAYRSHPSLLRLADGTLVVAFLEGMRRREILHSPADPSFRTLLSRSRDGGRSWTAPAVVPGYDWHGVECPSLTRLASGDLLLFQWRWRWQPWPEEAGPREPGLYERAGYPWARGNDGAYVHRSRDGGLTWEPASAGLPPDLAVYTIAPDPARPGRLLAGTIGAGLVRSDDGGATWAPAGSGIPPRTNVFAILSAPGGRLALGTSAGFIGSADGGETWSWSRATLGHTRVLALAVDPAAPERLIAGADDGVYLSPDAGRTWRRLAEGVPADEHVGAVAVVGRRVIVGAGPAYAVDLP